MNRPEKKEEPRSYRSFEDMQEEWKKERKEHPIRCWLEGEWYRIERGFKFLCFGMWREIKYFWQRGRRGWADRDVWCLSGFLSDILPAMLEKLKEEKYGIPCEFVYDKDGKEVCEKDAINAWDKELDKMIKTFKVAREISDSDAEYIPTDEWDEEKYKKLKKMVDGWNKKCADYQHRVLTKEEALEYEHGWQVFQQLFFNLWD